MSRRKSQNEWEYKARKRNKRNDKPSGESKRAFFRLVVLIFIAIILFLAFKIGPHYFYYYKFKFEIPNAISYADAVTVFHGNVKSEENLKKYVIFVAQRNKIILEEKNIRVVRLPDGAEINVEYTVTVDFLIMKRDLNFQIKENSYAL